MNSINLPSFRGQAPSAVSSNELYSLPYNMPTNMNPQTNAPESYSNSHFHQQQINSTLIGGQRKNDLHSSNFYNNSSYFPPNSNASLMGPRQLLRTNSNNIDIAKTLHSQQRPITISSQNMGYYPKTYPIKLSESKNDSSEGIASNRFYYDQSQNKTSTQIIHDKGSSSFINSQQQYNLYSTSNQLSIDPHRNSYRPSSNCASNLPRLTSLLTDKSNLVYYQQRSNSHSIQPPWNKLDTSKTNNSIVLINSRISHFNKSNSVEKELITEKIIFPDNIVESTKPVFKKMKRINSVGNVDTKKILMSLKSGLLAESTWALDCLNILSSNGSFKIFLFPNVLPCLLEHYKCYLNTLFDNIFADTDNDFQDEMMESHLKTKNNLEILIEKGRKFLLLDSINYTTQTRNGLAVKVEQDENEKVFNHSIDYSRFENFCDHQYLKDGNTFSTRHIIQTMDPLTEMIKFIKEPLKIQQVFEVSQNKHEMKSSYEEFNRLISTNFQINKRKAFPEEDDEAELYKTDAHTTLCPRLESLENLIKRCYCISTIIRNLSFLPENARQMSQSSSLILILARLLSFHHKHLESMKMYYFLHKQDPAFEKENMNEELKELLSDFSFETLHLIRNNSFVTLSNISEFLDLSNFNDKVILPFLDGLLHWAVCQSSYSQDSLPPDDLSFQVQAFEIIAKLGINLSNIDLILATPPFQRIESFYRILIQQISQDNPVLRELAIVILSNFACNDYLSARIILHMNHSIINLLMFIEQYECWNRMLAISSYQMPIKPSVEPFTISYMLVHAAQTLRSLASECDRSDLRLIKKYEDRIVNLIMSNFLEPEVTQILADLVYILSSRKIEE